MVLAVRVHERSGDDGTNSGDLFFFYSMQSRKVHCRASLSWVRARMNAGGPGGELTCDAVLSQEKLHEPSYR